MKSKSNADRDVELGAKRANKQKQKQQQLLLVANGDSSANVSTNSSTKAHKPTANTSSGKFPDLSRRHTREDSDDTDEDDTVNKSKMSHCFRRKWIILLSMTIILTLAAILVAILTVSLLDNQDQCYENFPFQRPNYKLFATKTAYSSAHQQLEQQLAGNNYDTNSDEVPNIFVKSQSLKQLHDKLTSGETNCRLKQFHYFGRHAARFPSSKRISQLNRLVAEVQNRIDLAKYSLPTSANSSSAGSPTSGQPDPSNRSAGASNSSATVCYNPLAQYKLWTSFMVPEQDNLIMDSGAQEASNIAARYKAIYPEMFDAKQAKIEIGTTEELRTAQTALEFVKQMDNFTLDFCELHKFPLDNLSDRSKAGDIVENACLRQFLRQFNKDKLAFHKRCRSLAKKEIILPSKLNLKDPKRIESIALAASRKLRLAESERLSAEETRALYRLCTFESAQSGSSIWCNLFSDDEMKFFEFIEDVDDYFNQAYGDQHQYQSACPITTELMKSFESAGRAGQPKSHFYFTHSEVIMKLIAASVDLASDPEYVDENIMKHLNAGTTPSRRQWRTSLFAPLSANLAFSLYECPKSSASNRAQPLAAAIAPNQAGSGGNYLDMDVGEKSYKVIASLNEMPILLDGCANHTCDVSELTRDSRIGHEKRCKMEDICKFSYKLPTDQHDLVDTE